ncbi:MAG: hypothetical protein R3245_08350, partial [Kiloniellales bacterium]|nr:hypothetical protein [Kiloniellales bacterium]
MDRCDEGSPRHTRVPNMAALAPFHALPLSVWYDLSDVISRAARSQGFVSSLLRYCDVGTFAEA